MRSLQDERLGLQKIRAIRVIRGKKPTHNSPLHNSQLTKSLSPPLKPTTPNSLPSSLRQAQDDNNGITCFLKPNTFNSKPTHNSPSPPITSFQSFQSACKKNLNPVAFERLRMTIMELRIF